MHALCICVKCTRAHSCRIQSFSPQIRADSDTVVKKFGDSQQQYPDYCQWSECGVYTSCKKKTLMPLTGPYILRPESNCEPLGHCI